MILLILVMSITGCQELQVRQLLTPERSSGEVPTAGTPSPASSELPSATPPSTIHAIITPTATLTPTLTLTPSPTVTPIPCTETEGTILYESFISRITGQTFRYRIYLPPCYGVSARRYPTLYMLHGLGEGMDDSQWDKMGLDETASLGISQGTLAPMIIVMPNGLDAGHHDSFGVYPEVIVEELIPHVEQHYCTWGEPAGRAIGGLSRGGYWAYWIAFSHPELFARVGGHSPYFFEPDSPAQKNPVNLVDIAPGLEHLAMYFDHGPYDYDIVLLGVADFVDRLARRGLESQYVINSEGGHTEDYWAAHTADYLNFYATEWPLDVNSLPSCHADSPADSP